MDEGHSVIASLQKNGNPDWIDMTSTASPKVAKLYSNFVLTPGTLERHADRLGFWERSLASALESGMLQETSCLWFETAGIEDKFRIGSLTPRGLETVLKHLKETKTIQSVSEFEADVSWPNWVIGGALSLAQWGVSQVLGASDSHQKFKRGKYLFLPLLEKLSRQVLDTIQETIHHPSDCIKTQSEITTQLQTLIIYPQDMELILLFLERRGDITRTVSPKLHDCIIKFKFKLQSSAKPLQKVNEQEEGIAVLKFTALKIEKQADVLSKKVEDLVEKAKYHLSKGQRELALFCIKQKKTVTEVLKKRLGNLETLQAILLKIEHAETEMEVLAAYQIGADTLKSVIASTGLTPESVESVMDNLADSLADYNDIEQAMDDGQRAVVPSDADEKELEQELEALVASEVAAEQETLVTRLPSVPVSAEDLATQMTGLTMDAKEPSKKEDTRKKELEPVM